MRTTTLLTLLLATLALASCQSTPETRAEARKRELQREQSLFTALTDRGLARGEQIRRVPNFRISGWQEVDDYSLILTAGVRNRYLVTFIAPCRGLDFAVGIGLATSTGALDDTDSILVRGTVERVERCPIKDIFALEELPGYVEEESAEDA